jgi:hypothetical protein
MWFVDAVALSRHTAGAAPDDRFAAAAHYCHCCQPPRRFDYLHGLKTHQVRIRITSLAAGGSALKRKIVRTGHDFQKLT